jgi:hypothetical protein
VEKVIPPESQEPQYEGDLEEDGLPTGLGTMKWPNGDKYVGTFLKGERHGQGKITYSNESEIKEFDGEWENGNKLRGSQTYKNGS